MYRVNRIGTPHIHNPAFLQESGNTWTLAISTTTTPFFNANVINPSPGSEFDRSALQYANATGKVLSGNDAFCFGQQFTVQQPIQGNVTGIEVMGAITIDAPSDTLIYPIIMKVGSVGPGVLAQATPSNGYTNIGDNIVPYGSVTTKKTVSYSYRTQVLLQDDLTGIGGVYLHGIRFIANTGFTMNNFYMHAAVRQYLDQTDIEYEDTRR